MPTEFGPGNWTNLLPRGHGYKRAINVKAGQEPGNKDSGYEKNARSG